MTEKLLCCERGERLIPFRHPAHVDGPDRPGFCIDVNGGGYPDPAWELIAFCPFCGKRVWSWAPPGPCVNCDGTGKLPTANHQDYNECGICDGTGIVGVKKEEDGP